MIRTFTKRWGALLLAATTLAAPLAAQEGLSALLDKYARKADLSNLTKKEAGGNLIVYTRQDLETMQIRQLKELLEKIPFLYYKEDNYGLTNMFYGPYQPASNVGIKLYLNDRALEIPYGGNALRVYAQVDMSHIDHVEIYLGAPALSFGIQQGAYVIKLYTKDPAREETDVAGAIAGTYGTKDLYAYSAHTVDDGLGYLLYANYMDLKRKKIRTENAALSRNKRIGHFFGEVRKEHHRVEFEAFRLKLEQFYGASFRMDPLDGYPYSFATNLYGGYYYDNPESGIKGFVNYTRNETDYHDASHSGLGIVPVAPTPGYPYPFKTYRTRHSEFNDQMIDAQLRKSFRWERWQNETGLQLRYKKFDFSHASIDGTEIDTDAMRSQETIYSLFTETGYQPDPNNMLLLSVKAERYVESDDFNDRNQFFARAGYIYNSRKWTFKSFAMGGDFIPDLRSLYENGHLFGVHEKLDSSTAYALSGQLIRKETWGEASLLLAATELQNALYFGPGGGGLTDLRYQTLEEPLRFYTAWANMKRELDESNTLSLDGWAVRMQDDNPSIASRYGIQEADRSDNSYGASLSHDFMTGHWTLHNDLIYRYFPGHPRGLDWNLALTWRPSRQLTLFVKANNILDRATTNNYLAVDPTQLFLTGTPALTELKNVEVFDQRVWTGVEYSF